MYRSLVARPRVLDYIYGHESNFFLLESSLAALLLPVNNVHTCSHPALSGLCIQGSVLWQEI
jgi:hypothetical protein